MANLGIVARASRWLGAHRWVVTSTSRFFFFSKGEREDPLRSSRGIAHRRQEKNARGIAGEEKREHRVWN